MNMSRYFNIFNLALLILMGGLCVYQWRNEKEYARRIADLYRTSTDQAVKISEQCEAIRRTNEDLDGFKGQVTALKAQGDEQNAQLRQQKAQIFTLEQDKDKITRLSDNRQAALDEYKKAVAERDVNITTLLEQREQLVTANKDAAGKANQAIIAYNELSAKYEDVVNRYNTLATSYNTERQAAGKATTR